MNKENTATNPSIRNLTALRTNIGGGRNFHEKKPYISQRYTSGDAILRFGETVDSLFCLTAETSYEIRGMCTLMCDPLNDSGRLPSNWLKCFQHVTMTYGEGSNEKNVRREKNIVRLHRRATTFLKKNMSGDYNKRDYLNVWLAYAKVLSSFKDLDGARRTYKQIQFERIHFCMASGECDASYYVTYAAFEEDHGKATEAQDILSEGIRISAKPVQLLHDAMKQMDRRVNLRTVIPSLCANASHFANHTSKPNIASTNDITIVASTASPPPQSKQQLTKLGDKDDDDIAFKDERDVMASENAAHVSDPTVTMAMEINPPPPLPPSHTFSSVLLKDKNRSKAESNINESNNSKAVSFAPTLRMKTASTSNHSIPSKSKNKFGKPVRIQAQKQHTPASLSSSFSDDNTSSTVDKKNESTTLKLTKSDLSYMLNWDPTAPRAKRKLNHNQNNAISEVSLSKVDEEKNEVLDNVGTTATYNTIGTSSSGISSLTSATNASSVEVVTAVESSCESTRSLHNKQTINESPTTKNVQHRQSESSIPSSVNQDCNNNNMNTNTLVSSNHSIHHNAFPTLSTPQQHQAAQLHSISSNYSCNNIRFYNDDCDPDFLPLVLKKNVFKVNSISYCKLSTIGKGASCKVYKVLSKDHNVYALKKVRLEGMKKKEVDGFSNEINLLKRLRGNPSIIQLIDAQVALDRKSILVVMELGEVDLHHVLQQQQQSGGSIGKLNINFIRLTWQQMLTAVHSIHEERIVHGDLKPANFLFVRGALKLIDFGIAKAIQSDDTTNIYRDSAMGTVNYMAPEAINGHCDDGRLKLGRASDIWSLGCILYQMLFGRTPFYNLKNMIKKLQAIADPRYKIPYPDDMVVSEAAVDAAKLCLRRNPNDRPPIVADEKNRAQVGLLNNHKFLRS